MRLVSLGPDSVRGAEQPERILVGNRWEGVEGIADRWRESGRWWQGEEPRDFFLVETSRGAFVISRGQEGWRIEEVMD